MIRHMMQGTIVRFFCTSTHSVQFKTRSFCIYLVRLSFITGNSGRQFDVIRQTHINTGTISITLVALFPQIRSLVIISSTCIISSTFTATINVQSVCLLKSGRPTGLIQPVIIQVIHFSQFHITVKYIQIVISTRLVGTDCQSIIETSVIRTFQHLRVADCVIYRKFPGIRNNWYSLFTSFGFYQNCTIGSTRTINCRTRIT